jgi:hypothetical protein
VTWLLDNRFYSYSVVADAALEVIFAETGAGDPNFNLVPGSGLVLRAVGTANVTFVSLIEPHGEYNGSREYTVASQSNVAALEHVASKQNDKVKVRFNAGEDLVLGISWDPDPDQSHRIETAGSSDRWKGFFALLKG